MILSHSQGARDTRKPGYEDKNAPERSDPISQLTKRGIFSGTHDSAAQANAQQKASTEVTTR